MDRTRILFLLIGSVFLGIGMITAGLFKIAQDQVVSGVVLIVGTIIIIVLCALPILNSKKDGKS